MGTALTNAFLSMLGMTQASKFSCVMAMLDNADYIPEIMSRLIPNDNLVDDGIERESHITCLYGLHTNNPIDVIKYIMDIKPFEVTIGQISKFDSNPDFDVIKCDVEGPELYRINELLKTLPYTNSYNEYIPHMTLAYVKKGSCDHLLGNNMFSGHKFMINRLMFSDSESRKGFIQL